MISRCPISLPSETLPRPGCIESASRSEGPYFVSLRIIPAELEVENTNGNSETREMELVIDAQSDILQMTAVPAAGQA